MRAYAESGFYVLYLVFMIGAGCHLLLSPAKREKDALFGAACVLLGVGDAFHLIPRAVGLFEGTLDHPGAALAAWLGIGKLVTSITMTGFYVLLWYFLFRRSGAKRSAAGDGAVWVLTLARVVLCALPGNGWLQNASSLFWGTLRNIPFILLGILVLLAAFRTMRAVKSFRLLWLAILLSFAFYLPVVFFAAEVSWVGMLMLPKTLMYAWIALMGLSDSREKI